MDMNNSLVVGAGALLVGILIGYSMGGSGDELAEQGLARTEALSARVEEMAGKLDGLESKVTGVEGSVAQFASAQSDGLKGLGDQIGTRIDGIGESVGGAVDKLGASVSDTVKGQIEGLRAQIATLRGGAAEPASEGAESAESAPPAPAAAPGAGTTVTPGMTAVVAPDKLHVFLSATDPAAGTAMVAVNGQTLSTIKLGEEQEANGCHFTLTGFDGRAATIDGGC
ncbi:MAG: hypothetical protein DI556_18950 [Rhodovulum sulfidophilum]|uniref:Uncharacterized protein n=1 Tax=Rhodovulum sulfidophilum TaxID=35806 RepID=A0A2W5N0E7_RHOSU|nr:MAG: hypothetical protein DI556_18950 [Rhodovulum sulfidophilum]